MSRIGSQDIEVPQGVTAAVEGGLVKVKGSKGELSTPVLDELEVALKDGVIAIKPRDADKNPDWVKREKGEARPDLRKMFDKRTRSMWGLQRTLIANMIEGVTNGFSRSLALEGVGYRAQMQGTNLKLTLGFSHDVVYTPPEGVKLEAPKPTEIIISGPDKQKVGQAAAEIRRYRPPEPYKGKGVRYAGERIRRKEGKKK